jgi:two-component system response regulator VicR
MDEKEKEKIKGKELEKERKKIMIVDNDPDVVDTVGEMLKSEGYEVIGAYSGRECLKKLGAEPDLILLDIMMPEMDGWETLDKIKGISDVPVSMMTVIPLVPEIVEGKPINKIENYIVKLFSKEELVEKVGEIFEKEKKTEKIVERLRKKIGEDIAEEYENRAKTVYRHNRLIKVVMKCAGEWKERKSVRNVIKSQQRLIEINEKRMREIEELLDRLD